MNPFEHEAIQLEVIARASRVKGHWTAYLANPTGDFKQARIRMFLDLLDAYASGYLKAVESKDLVSQYETRIRYIGSKISKNASETAFRSRPELELKNQIRLDQELLQIETLYEARYSHWRAEAIEKVGKREQVPQEELKVEVCSELSTPTTRANNPTEPLSQTEGLNSRQQLVQDYKDEVFRATKRRLTDADIWRKAGYKNRTEFERWKSDRPGRGRRPNIAAGNTFRKLLTTDKPHLKDPK